MFADNIKKVNITKPINIKPSLNKKVRSSSLLIPKNSNFNTQTQSINFKNSDSTFISYDDCKIITHMPAILKQAPVAGEYEFLFLSSSEKNVIERIHLKKVLS